jgi:hypothetical protein
MPVGLEPDRLGRREPQAPDCRGKVLAPQVVGGEEEIRPRFPGALPGLLPNRYERLLRFRPLPILEKVRGPRKRRVVVRGRRRRRFIAAKRDPCQEDERGGQ